MRRDLVPANGPLAAQKSHKPDIGLAVLAELALRYLAGERPW
jgi:hypothetical protein